MMFALGEILKWDTTNDDSIYILDDSVMLVMNKLLFDYSSLQFSVASSMLHSNTRNITLDHNASYENHTKILAVKFV